MAQHWIATRPGGLDVFLFEEYDVPPPQQGEVTIAVRAAGMNPADAKHVTRGDAAEFPKAIGYEVAGVVTAVGPDTGIGSGPVAVGDEVLAYRISGGWATEGSASRATNASAPTGRRIGRRTKALSVGTTGSPALCRTGGGVEYTGLTGADNPTEAVPLLVFTVGDPTGL